jgi:hypothetical protein
LDGQMGSNRERKKQCSQCVCTGCIEGQDPWLILIYRADCVLGALKKRSKHHC